MRLRGVVLEVWFFENIPPGFDRCQSIWYRCKFFENILCPFHALTVLLKGTSGAAGLEGRCQIYLGVKKDQKVKNFSILGV